MEFHFGKIEEEVKEFWKKNRVYETDLNQSLPKLYVLDMFPYPSGAGLHVGHPLGYIASDIYARYKRLKGFNVMHPMGFDSFGLPAEQYAIQTGQHPAVTTEQNIATFKEQMSKIGFSFDWRREIKTSDPQFYKWTQWIFIRLFHSWYNRKSGKAEPIASLILEFSQNGNAGIDAASGETKTFTSSEWTNFSAKEKSDVLLNYRLAYLADSIVNWCPALGTVLANDEVKDGVSERGSYPVERKRMTQWSLRITAYADRLLEGLNRIDWSESVKELQRNWIGRSEGCSVKFRVESSNNSPLLRRGVGGEEEEQKPDLRKRGGYLTGNKLIGTFLRDHARENRKSPTEAETLLWERLRDKKLGVKFRRQHPIDLFIVDFVCLEKKIIIELDGEDHKQNRESDEERTKTLNSLGYKVIRFWNEDFLRDISSCLDLIRKEINSRPNLLTPNPSPEESGMENLSSENISIEVFTTRPDTIFGATFITLAPEHELIEKITSPDYKQAVDEYVKYAKNRSERERMTDVKKITGQFTGAYAIHPFIGNKIPIWIAGYVLAGYGTGAVMAVPAHDSRDYEFAKHFQLPIVEVVKGGKIDESAYEGEGLNINSDFLDGLNTPESKRKAIEEIEKRNLGVRRVNYKMRDAIFGRQRYWGEPIPVYYDDQGIPNTVDEKDLPVKLPEVKKYLPTETGEPPLARATDWKYRPTNSLKGVGSRESKSPLRGDSEGYPFELTTMPGWAGSSWYYLRYGDPHNENVFASKESIDYWGNIDLYVGGEEHAVGHLLYFRFWTKFLFDLGLIPFDEPAKKLVNQGMVQGKSAKIFKTGIDFKHQKQNLYRSFKYMDAYGEEQVISFEDVQEAYAQNQGLAHVTMIYFSHNKYLNEDYMWDQYLSTVVVKNFPIEFVENNELDIEEYLQSPMGRSDQFDIFITSGGFWFNSRFHEKNSKGSKQLTTFPEVEKMSKSKYNVINPDDVISKYGADAFRLYEMFLGPLEQSKPWDTKGIDGCSRFLKKFWRLFFDESGNWMLNDQEPTEEELKTLARTIKKTGEDVETLSLNTAVSAFMICVNELSRLDCHKRKILEPLLISLSPFAPFTTEYLWLKEGKNTSVTRAAFPDFDPSLLVENSFEYPVAVNGRTRMKMQFGLDVPTEQIEKEVLSAEALAKYFEGRIPKKVIVVKGKMINVVV